MTNALSVHRGDAESTFMATSSRPEPPKTDGSIKTVTMKDIARVAGVTSMTVSRVMKGEGRVSPATREAVLRVAEEMNYVTNLAGRALKTGRTNVIAVICGSLTHPYYANLVSLLESQLTTSGYQMRLVLSQGDVRALIHSTNAAAVDGVIVAGLHYLLRELRASGRQIVQPYVNISLDELENEDHVRCNLVPAVEETLKLMLDAGRQRIAYVGIGTLGQNFSITDAEVRTHAYVVTMENAERTPELISSGASYALSGPERVEILKAHFKEHGCPDALLCVNDDTAIHTYRALMDLKIKIPDDVLLVGCDGLPIMEYFEPPLSTIAQPMEEICARAWQFLQARMQDRSIPPQNASFDAHLVVRRSLGD